ncbi:MAG TPA: leucine-rich repeat domain-containing protein [Kiritimatiellia bacterium]|nr:leucine-rich repeat domain-containing protein [Kiritimatiellia bacterium]HPS07659.1 leucine-rich repeat domain-containing protein [Kiritimatiellia bacterium]
MRGISVGACLIALVWSFLPCTSNALTLGNYTYTTNASGKATITGFNSSYSGALSITNSLDGSPVVAIANDAFRERTRLTAVTIPDSVASIGTWAFAYCSALGRVTIGAGISAIPERAFHNCSALTAITIPDTVTSIGKDAFSGCDRLVSADIGDGVVSIGFAAFFACNDLAHVSIGSKVRTIEDWAFLGCNSLVDFTVDAANTAYASADGVLFDKGLTTLIQCPAAKSGSCAVPASVTAIGDFAFQGCASLSAITVDAANTAYASADGVLFDKGLTTLIQCPAGKSGSYAIPSGVTAIGYRAFAECSLLTAVTVPASVTAIGDYAFDYCEMLTAVLFLGDAPAAGEMVFMSSYPTLCYLPGAAGWDATLDGLSALCWNPSVRSDAPFGFSGGCFGFTVAGTPGIPVGIEASTNLAAAVWTPVVNGTIGTGGALAVSDPASAWQPARFYRVVFP